MYLHPSSVIQRIFGIKARKDPAVLRLPDHILHSIYEHLSLVDQVCLSLSCRTFFDLYGSVVKHVEFAFPRLFILRLPMALKSQAVLRNQLLLRLQNRRWACCWGCLKLHPRKEFPWHSHLRPSLDRSCTAFAGIADLCPCISLTLRARERLISFLKSSPKPETKYGPFVYTFNERGLPCLSHTCAYMYTHIGYTMDFGVYLSINSAGGLRLVTRHRLQFPSPDTYIKAVPMFVCPHQDLLSPKNWDGDQVWIDKTCVYCRTNYSTSSEGRIHPEFWAVRNLGSCKWRGDISWYNQCRLPATPTVFRSLYR